MILTINAISDLLIYSKNKKIWKTEAKIRIQKTYSWIWQDHCPVYQLHNSRLKYDFTTCKCTPVSSEVNTAPGANASTSIQADRIKLDRDFGEFKYIVEL